MYICPKCGKEGYPSTYLPMCTSCANEERFAKTTDEDKDDGPYVIVWGCVFMTIGLIVVTIILIASYGAIK